MNSMNFVEAAGPMVHMIEEDEVDTSFQNDDDLVNLMTFLDSNQQLGQFPSIKIEHQVLPHIIQNPYVNVSIPSHVQYMYPAQGLPAFQPGQHTNGMQTAQMMPLQQMQMQPIQNIPGAQVVYTNVQIPRINFPFKSTSQMQMSSQLSPQSPPTSPTVTPKFFLQPNNSPQQSMQSPQMTMQQQQMPPIQPLPLQQVHMQVQSAQQVHSPRGPERHSSPRVSHSGSPRTLIPPPQATQANAPLQPYQQTINEILKLHMTQKEQLEKMRGIQKQVLLNPQKETFAMLDTEQNNLKKQVEQELNTLRQIDSTYLLSPTEIRQVVYLIHELTLQSIQLDLYHEELQLLVHPTQTMPCIGALVVIDQPFPMVITKGKPLEDDPVIVQLLSGARTEFQSLSKVKATLVMENHQSSKAQATQKTIETEVVPMDDATRIAKYHLKFLNGTRKNPVTLKFSMQVQVAGGAGAVTIETAQSHPFIVITNECQYEESDGTLLKKDAFGNNNEIAWATFANKLQRHFLRATRQDPIKPARYLSRHELLYLHQNFFGGKGSVSQQTFDSFWAWFGKGLQKLRYQRHICSMWQSGLIYGFISRTNVDEALKNEETGTFLIRFSERHAGLFAIGYKVDDASPPELRVRHYLVRPDDTAGAKKTLPDFLSECPQFSRILQLTIDPNTGDPRLRNFPKDVVLEPYYSKRDSLTPNPGYEILVPSST